MDSPLSELTISDFLQRLSTDAPAPGGGSASAIAGAIGAALVQMVVSLTRDRPTAAGHEDALREIGLGAAGFQSELLHLADTDATAYASVVAARRLPRDSDRDRENRRVQIDAAVREATRAPLHVAVRAAQTLELAERLAPIGNRNAISDVGVAGLLAAAAIRGAALNVRINLPFLPDDAPLRRDAGAAVDRLLDGLEEREAALRAAVAERLE